MRDDHSEGLSRKTVLHLIHIMHTFASNNTRLKFTRSGELPQACSNKTTSCWNEVEGLSHGTCTWYVFFCFSPAAIFFSVSAVGGHHPARHYNLDRDNPDPTQREACLVGRPARRCAYKGSVFFAVIRAHLRIFLPDMADLHEVIERCCKGIGGAPSPGEACPQ